MKANPEKGHLLLSSKTPKKAYFCGALIESISTEKLLGIQIDSDLTFDEHLSSICNKIVQKINVLSRLVNYVSLDKGCIVMKAFIESQFNHCPLIWMFHSKTLNNKINRLHERALRIVYSDYKSSFCELLRKGKSFSIHHKSIQSLAIEIYKFLHNLSPCIMNNIFKVNQTVPYDLRKRKVLQSRKPTSVRYGTETISYMAPKIWTLFPETIKSCDRLKSFKQKIRKWKSDCPCRLCKVYLQHVGFV